MDKIIVHRNGWDALHAEVDKWSADKSGYLHLYRAEKEIATFPAGSWTLVEVVPEPKPNAALEHFFTKRGVSNCPKCDGDNYFLAATSPRCFDCGYPVEANQNNSINVDRSMKPSVQAAQQVPQDALLPRTDSGSIIYPMAGKVDEITPEDKVRAAKTANIMSKLFKSIDDMTLGEYGDLT